MNLWDGEIFCRFYKMRKLILKESIRDYLIYFIHKVLLIIMEDIKL